MTSTTTIEAYKEDSEKIYHLGFAAARRLNLKINNTKFDCLSAIIKFVEQELDA